MQIREERSNYLFKNAVRQSADPVPTGQEPSSFPSDPPVANGRAQFSFDKIPIFPKQTVTSIASDAMVARTADDSDRPTNRLFASAESGAGSLLSGAENVLSGAASGIGGLAKSEAKDMSALADAGGQASDFLTKPMLDGVKSIDKGMDWAESSQQASTRNMVEQTKDIPILGGLAQGLGTAGNITTDIMGGTVKGVGDLAGGVISGVAHPLNAVGSMEGIVEHDSTIPGLGTMLKAGHGAYDLMENGGGQYGNSMGDLANHILNPLQQEKDDAKFNTGMAQGIIAPEGWDKWKANPIDAMARAATNIGPMIGGIGEGSASEALGENGPRPTPPEGVAPNEPAPTPPANEAPAPKAKNPMSKTGLFDQDEFNDWYDNKRKLGVPYDPKPQSPNNATGEWGDVKIRPDMPGSHNPVFDNVPPGQSRFATTVDPAKLPNQPIVPEGVTPGDDPMADTVRPGGTLPGLQPFSPGDTLPGMDPWGDNPWEPIK